MAAPLGNQNAKKAHRWTNAVERAIDAYPDKPVSLSTNKGIDAAAFEFVSRMMTEKDLGFFREFGDRLEGKPAQSVTLGSDEDSPLRHVHTVGLVDLK